ncbi:MAG: hydrogenase maturation nickel metallochaperone HypA [Sedimenticolaceae bacterium]|nr:hydrogenase maturation nickel metallochaperone HypA [Sedimenticolaceae bacterium]
MAISESIVQIIEEQAEAKNFSGVRTVWLEIGRFAGIEVEALRFTFEVVSRNSVAEGSSLEIIEIPGSAWCMECGKNVDIQQRFDPCPECGGFQVQVSGGDGMRIKELEVN